MVEEQKEIVALFVEYDDTTKSKIEDTKQTTHKIEQFTNYVLILEGIRIGDFGSGLL